MDLFKNDKEEKMSKPEETSIEELFKDTKDDYHIEEYDWGEPKGNEVW